MIFESNTSGNTYVMEVVDGKWYIYRWDKKENKVYSCLEADNPENGVWVSTCNDEGIKYVSKGRSESSAMRQWKLYVLGIEECPDCGTTLELIRNSTRAAKFFCPHCQKFHIIPYKEVC